MPGDEPGDLLKTVRLQIQGAGNRMPAVQVGERISDVMDPSGSNQTAVLKRPQAQLRGEDLSC
jgi:hypothetical protein